MTTTTRSAVVIQHDPHIHLGNLEPLLRARGFRLRIVDPKVSDAAALDPEDGDLLIVLGGHEGAYELDRFPYLRGELKLIRSRIDAELPILGICLGAQLMAGSLGARNYKADTIDYGYRELELTDAGAASPLRHTRGVAMLEWHDDHFELPEEATLLATSAGAPNEAYAIGDFALGVQFHPEVTDEMHDVWTADTESSLHRHGISIDDWRALRDEHNDAMQTASAAIFTEWLDAIERRSDAERLSDAGRRTP
ncbi:MAG: gamma-glutamyl-gamma-aminobutyrate hydrolase family protein [Cryobacterium sp.]|nr:gamma-glutamyl-gamma-aminobutyrate hydrolase family protein [Cryobacterium sp.]